MFRYLCVLILVEGNYAGNTPSKKGVTHTNALKRCNFRRKTARKGVQTFKLADGGGLHLLVTPAGSRWWRLRFRVHGKEKMLSLGTFPDVSLKLARERRDQARRDLANGIDPSGVVMCAEVAAVTAANTAGDLDIEAIAVVGHRFLPPRDASQIVTPCGRCRQILSEAAQLVQRDIRVFSCNGELSRLYEAPISELIPAAFGAQNLGLPETWPTMQKALREIVAQLNRDDPH